MSSTINNCCRCNNSGTIACYHVGPCNLCSAHGGPAMGDPHYTLSPFLPFVEPLNPTKVVPGTVTWKEETVDIMLLRQILEELKGIKKLLETK